MLSTRTSGARGLITPGQNGWFFDLDTPAEFQAALDEAFSDENRRQALAKSGQDLVRAKYNSDELSERIRNLYQELIEEKHAIRHSARR